MIKVSIDLIASIYLLISVCILFMWIFLEKRRKYEKTEENTLWCCPICFYEYVDSKSNDISRCPRCKTLHKKGER
ncbi:MAG TPA: hypothetical protein PKV21_00300 [bacterium]|nr:hypothetical protein [bacterium]